MTGLGQDICKCFKEEGSAIFWLAWAFWESLYPGKWHPSPCAPYVITEIWGSILNLSLIILIRVIHFCHINLHSRFIPCCFLKTLKDYLKPYGNQYAAVLAFRPTGESYVLLQPTEVPFYFSPTEAGSYRSLNHLFNSWFI